MKLKYTTISLNQTKKIGEILAKEILSSPLKNSAFTIGLEGDLGGGKTTFLQGFAKGLGIKERVLSPTFVLMKKFSTSKFRNFYHIDCYRIKNKKEIMNLGFQKIISNPKNIVAIEWVDRIEKIIPQNTIWIIFKFIDKNKREIVIKSK